MPFQLKAAPSSRVRKTSASQASRRDSPFARHARSKPFIQRSPASTSPSNHHQQRNDELADQEESYYGYSGDALPDAGPSNYVAETTGVTNVIQAIQYARNTMFSDVPESRPGMNSTRIAQVLNFRRSLPPIVSVAHVHMLLDAPTKVEREIVQLIEAATVRRLLIPGRGGGVAGLGDCLVLVEDWEELVRNNPSLDKSLQDTFIHVLRNNTRTAAVSAGLFSAEESSALVRAGFLVSPSSLTKETSINPSLPTTSKSNAATADDDSGDPSNASHPQEQQQPFRDKTMFLSVPNMGPYLRLLAAGRSQLASALQKSSQAEAPLYLLRDRWEGAVESQSSSASVAKRARGEAGAVLPGKTKKWKELYGMNFRWVLEEALGAGLVELFETGSVGPGVRRL